MNILALDTTLGACSAAVLRGEGLDAEIFSAFELRAREHAEAIIPMVTKVMREAELGYGALDAIAVTSGPGSFTGVRVGVATARGLALATGMPIISATSLEVMAHRALGRVEAAPDTLGIAVDARRGEVYLALFDGAGALTLAPGAFTPEQAVDALPKTGRVLLAGGGAALMAAAARNAGREAETDMSELQPDAASLARMALTREMLKEPLKPLYLRPPDAKPQTGKSLPRRG